MAKVITSMNKDILSESEIRSWLDEFNAKNINITRLGEKDVIVFDIKSGMDITPTPHIEMIELSNLMGYAILYKAYSDGEEYYWSRNAILGKAKITYAVKILENGYSKDSDKYEEVINIFSSALGLSVHDCETLLIDLKGVIA